MTLGTPKVILAGDVCIDHNVVNGHKYVSWGSSLMYMNQYLVNHVNIDVGIIAAHGRDFNKYISGVNIINDPEPIETLVYENIVKGDRRTQFCHNIASSKPVNIDATLQRMFKHANIFVFAPLTPNYQLDYLQTLLKYIPKNALKALIPQGYLRRIRHDGLVNKSDFINEKSIVPLFDVIIASDEDCDDPFTTTEKWLSCSEKLNVVITQNKNGATLINKDGFRHIGTIPIPNTKIIDSVGSGDVFSAQMIASYYINGDILQAIDAGNNAAHERLLSPAA
jgi:sugar/nucleoside kinase (ribokinase family)